MDGNILGLIPTSCSLNLNVGRGPSVGTNGCDQGAISVKVSGNNDVKQGPSFACGNPMTTNCFHELGCVGAARGSLLINFFAQAPFTGNFSRRSHPLTKKPTQPCLTLQWVGAT